MDELVAGSVAIATIVFGPKTKGTLSALKVPLETWARTSVVPFTLTTTVAVLSSIVPETVTGWVAEINPS